MGRLAGKSALVTGGTGGIGLATAQRFLAEGARVAVTGASQNGLDEARRALGPEALVIPSDAGDAAGQKLVAERRARTPSEELDVLVRQCRRRRFPPPRPVR
jgi:NAD(P)-dependent dehydrogenase (short-subunit alcohol dehydrogenase family)